MTPLPTPQQLRYLLALADHQHFGQAAAACHVSQSTLSAGLLALERQLDTRILAREGGKRPSFTPLGHELVLRARTAVAALEAIAEAADAARAPMSGPLRLGVIPTIGPFLLPRLMPLLRVRYPRLRLFLREDTTARLLDRLAAGRLDLLLLALPYDCAGAQTLQVARDPFLVALPPGHPLAGTGSAVGNIGGGIAVQALAGERMLLLEEGHCLRDQALAACRRPSRADRPRPAELDDGHPDGFAATSLHTLVQMVAGGLGLTLLPQLAVDGQVTAGAEVVLRPLSGAGASRTLGLAWRANSPREAEFRGLAPLVAEAAKSPAGGALAPPPTASSDPAARPPACSIAPQSPGRGAIAGTPACGATEVHETLIYI
jgi:LysR family hydrogen peroxide-inducible transcriptional activator